MENIIILGSGIAGISAGYHLSKNGNKLIIFEKNDDWGGLCANFSIDGFRFDKFVHFSFADDSYIKELFESSSPLYDHPSLSYNYYKGCWLKHPAQNNLAPLSSDEKVKIINDFVSRPQKSVDEIRSYDEWLRCQFGNYFAENFPFRYTRKYWGVEAKELETKWAGIRIHSPDLEQVLKGSYETQKENYYYTNFMRYPKKGGFRSILDKCRKGLDIRFNKEVVRIDTKSKIVYFSDNTTQSYDRLISSLPLPDIAKMIDDAPANVLNAAASLRHTSGYMVSLGFKRPDVAKYLWFYIYDEDILSSRVYSPSLKSPDNAPKGCSSLQAEIFFDSLIMDEDFKQLKENEIKSFFINKLKEEADGEIYKFMESCKGKSKITDKIIEGCKAKGKKISDEIDKTNKLILKLLNLDERYEVVYTSGSSEANNLVINGLFSKFNNIK